MNVGIYNRISLDAEGEGLGVQRQEKLCRGLCELRGWQVAGVYTDNSISAYTKSTVRPEFERLLADLKAGRIDGFVAYDLDRVSRQPKQLEQIIDIYEDNPSLVFGTVTNDLDLSSGDGRTMARVMIAFANKSSADTSRRLKAKFHENAVQGKPQGSRRPYGYLADLVTIYEPEACVLREMGARLLRKHGYNEIARWANDQGHTTTQGKPFHGVTICNMLKKHRYGGVRSHNGTLYPAIWQGVFDPETWERLQLEIRIREAKNVPKARKYLLTGLLACGLCGGGMHGSIKRDRPTAPLRRVYHCSQCRKLRRNADALDQFIRDCVLFRLDTPELGELLTSSEDVNQMRGLLNIRAEHVNRIDCLIDDYATGLLTRDQFARAKASAESALAKTEADINRLTKESTGVKLEVGQTLRQAWDTNPTGWRRALIELLVARVVVLPGNSKPVYMVDGKAMRFDPELIRIEWSS